MCAEEAHIKEELGCGDTVKKRHCIRDRRDGAPIDGAATEGFCPSWRRSQVSSAEVVVLRRPPVEGCFANRGATIAHSWRVHRMMPCVVLRHVQRRRQEVRCCTVRDSFGKSRVR